MYPSYLLFDEKYFLVKRVITSTDIKEKKIEGPYSREIIEVSDEYG